MTTVGVDIGATRIKAARVDQSGAVSALAQRPTATDHPDTIVSDVVALVGEVSDADTVAVGVAVAAFLSRDRERIAMSPNISWRDRALRSELEVALGVPVAVENDANAAALGEYFLGSAKGAHSLVMVTLGTGVGGGVVVGGQLLVGAHGVAAELGHLVVVPGGQRCGCGQYGCLETVASGSAIVQAVRRARAEENLDQDAVEDILRGDPHLAGEVIDHVAQMIASALTSVAAVVDPDVVVLGGGVVERMGDVLVGGVSRHYQALLESRHGGFSPRFVPASLGNSAGIVGAALLAKRHTDA